MASPVNDSVSGLSGATIWFGRSDPNAWVTPSNNTVVLVGDSLTDKNLGLNWSPFFWINGLAGGGLQNVANAGVSGDTVQMMRARINNRYDDANRGLAGLGRIGVVFFRGGTNNARSGTTPSSITPLYSDLFDQIAAYTDLVILLSCPPIGPTEGNYAAENALTIQYNQILHDYAAANPAKFKYIDDSSALRNPDGSQISGSFGPDGVHNVGSTTTQEGLTAYGLMGSRIAAWNFPNGLATTSADVYPTQPQWFTNPTMQGTAGTMGTGFTGQVVTGLSIAGNGAGSTAVCSIVAADAGDANQTPWQRVAPTQVTKTGAGEAIQIYSVLNGRTITATDPVTMELSFEIRMNAFDTTWFNAFKLFVQGSVDVLTADCELKIGGGPLTKRVVVRAKLPKPNANASTFAHMYLNVPIANNNTGSMGSFDFRCITIRG